MEDPQTPEIDDSSPDEASTPSMNQINSEKKGQSKEGKSSNKRSHTEPRTREPGYIYHRTGNISEFYTVKKQIGNRGGFGTAYIAKERKTSKKVAIKVINKLYFAKYPAAQRLSFYDDMASEIDIMKRVHHPNIIHLYEVFEDSAKLYLVMQLCQGGELLERIVEKKHFSEKEAAVILHQMCHSLAYLHHHHVAHCDIKPDNFLFVSEADDSPIKLIDFGLSKILAKREHLHNTAGTAYYMAPEVLHGHYNQEADMWSLGAVMFVMLFGYPPFYAQDILGQDDDEAIFRMIDRGFNPIVKPGYGPWFPATIPVSSLARDLISRLMRKDIASRMTADEALQHPWLAGSAPATELADYYHTSLKAYQGANRFRRVLVGLLTDTLDDRQVDLLQKAFHDLDPDGTHLITAKQLKQTLINILPSTSDPSSSQIQDGITKLLAVTDAKDEQCFRYEDILMAAVHRRLLSKEERLAEAFRHLDKHKKGVISALDLKRVLEHQKITSLTEKDLNELFGKLGSDSINYDEFIALWYEDCEENILSMREKSFAPRPDDIDASVHVPDLFSVADAFTAEKQKDEKRIRWNLQMIQMILLVLMTFGDTITALLLGNLSYFFTFLSFIVFRSLALAIVDVFLLQEALVQGKRARRTVHPTMSPNIHPFFVMLLLSILQLRIPYEIVAQYRIPSRVPLQIRTYFRGLQMASCACGSFPLLVIEIYALFQDSDFSSGVISIIYLGFICSTFACVLALLSIEDPFSTITELVITFFFHLSFVISRVFSLSLLVNSISPWLFCTLPAIFLIDYFICLIIILWQQENSWERKSQAAFLTILMLISVPYDSLQNWKGQSSARPLLYVLIWKVVLVLILLFVVIFHQILILPLILAFATSIGFIVTAIFRSTLG